MTQKKGEKLEKLTSQSHVFSPPLSVGKKTETHATSWDLPWCDEKEKLLQSQLWNTKFESAQDFPKCYLKGPGYWLCNIYYM